jgi:glycosyltransferase involved in cell wall biosynthesis
MKKKICIAITKGVWGGAQEYVYALATSLPKDTYDVCVICGEGNILPQKLTDAGIRTITIPTLKRDVFFIDDIISFFTLRRILLQEKPDILHLNSSKMGGIGSLVGRLLRIPRIIFTAHAWASNESRFSFISRFTFRILHYITVILSHHTIAVSHKTKRDISGLPFIAHKITVIHNGISDIDFLPKVEARQAIEGMARLSTNTEIIIGTISELHKNKGLDLLIDACTNLPQYASVYIIGEGEERKRLQGMIDGYNLNNKVFLVGQVPNARKYLKAFDVFTLTSRTEALPYCLLEAGLAQCAVIATQVGGIPEIIVHEENGILIRRNRDELVNALNDLLDQKDTRHNIGASLRNTILDKFSIEEMLRKVIDVYHR